MKHKIAIGKDVTVMEDIDQIYVTKEYLSRKWIRSHPRIVSGNFISMSNKNKINVRRDYWIFRGLEENILR